MQTLLLAALFGLTSLLPAQQPGPSARLTFEVATIRPAQPGETDGGIRPLPGGQEYWARNVPIKLIISLMYKVPLRQVIGGPDWVQSDLWDIEAKADHPTNLDDLHVMFRNLLQDRFNLKSHIETRQGPVYALTVDKGGVKMHRDPQGESSGGNYPIDAQGRGKFTGTRVTMTYLSYWLGLILRGDERPVLDQTGLTGTWDFSLEFLPELPPNVSREQLPPDLADKPSLFDALPEQLGLKLQPERGPVEYFVIDHIDRPSPN